jgi:hypothetical protein
MVQDYLQNRSMQERSAWRESQAKKQFMEMLAEVGTLQPGGHRILPLNEPLDYTQYKGGKTKAKKITGIRRVRRVSHFFDPDKTMALLERKNLVAQCTRTEVVIDEAALAAAIFEELITDEEEKSISGEKEQFAFYLVEEGEAEAEEAEEV